MQPAIEAKAQEAVDIVVQDTAGRLSEVVT
jgi:signal recognition particle GTPase